MNYQMMNSNNNSMSFGSIGNSNMTGIGSMGASFNNFSPNGQLVNYNKSVSRNSALNGFNNKEPVTSETKVEPSENCKDFQICDPKTQRQLDNVPNEVKMPADEEQPDFEEKVNK